MIQLINGTKYPENKQYAYELQMAMIKRQCHQQNVLRVKMQQTTAREDKTFKGIDLLKKNH